MSRGGPASRDKGNRAERAIVRLLQERGFAAERVPLSGAARGRFNGDVSIPLLVVPIELATEVMITAERAKRGGRTMKIIGADERLAQPRGVKILVAGPTGVGKTSLLRTLPDLSRVLFVDGEAGDLAVQDLPLDTIRVDDWQTARNIAVRIGGPNPSFAPTSCYSEAHYRAVGGALENLDRYDLIFVDSITAVSRLSFRWAEQQPEVRSERTGAKDLRGVYGLHGREMLMWLHQLQHVREKNVVFVV